MEHVDTRTRVQEGRMQTHAGECEGQELTNFGSKLKVSKPKLNEEDDHLDGVVEDGDDGASFLLWVPTGRRLLSGLLGLNVVLLGAALVAGDAFHPAGLRHQEPEVFLLLLLGLSVLWMLWFLLWARRQPGSPPHTDHHAGSVTVTVVLMLFAGFSLLLCMFGMVYNLLMKACRPSAKVLLPFMQVPFLALQAYLLWAHSKDCIHKHKVLTRCLSLCPSGCLSDTPCFSGNCEFQDLFSFELPKYIAAIATTGNVNRSGLMVILCTDILLWLNAVTEDSIHMEIELERQYKNTIIRKDTNQVNDNVTECHCSSQPACTALQRGYEVLYPFNMEFSLLAGCMLYIMWKNVGRHVNGSHSGHTQSITLRIMRYGGVLVGPVLGLVVLIAGVVVFVLYQVWVGQQAWRISAFLLFYSFHLLVMPLMVLCSLVGMLVYRCKEPLQHERSKDQGRVKNPTRSLDVLLLVGAGLGQVSLSYFSLVAALAMGSGSILEGLDLSYSLFSLLELVLQNVFIIEGLHKHTQPHLHAQSDHIRAKEKNATSEMRKIAEHVDLAGEEFLHRNSHAPTPPAGRPRYGTHVWSQRLIQEICAFLVLSNVLLWVIPAFGAHPQFESSIGREFYGFSVWFVLVNLGQPLIVFYRMHSVGALIELLISA